MYLVPTSKGDACATVLKCFYSVPPTIADDGGILPELAVCRKVFPTDDAADFAASAPQGAFTSDAYASEVIRRYFWQK